MQFLRLRIKVSNFLANTMNTYLRAAIGAAKAAGSLIRENFMQPLQVNAAEAHDLKLELDVRAQEVITKSLLREFPNTSVLGEEGSAETTNSEGDWIVDPIDGTVNFFYSIPHFSVSIAFRRAQQIEIGVIYDPIKDELWRAIRGEPAYLNDSLIQVSKRTSIGESILSVGFSKTPAAIDLGLKSFSVLVTKARKCRMMGSAALDLAYVASGRFDAYIEQSVNLWDIAAGWLLVESAGGQVSVKPSPLDEKKIAVIAWNGNIDLSELQGSLPKTT
jgi:myo-inositol-1(or 4)-monophosphatase